jgi:hypothetical protein
MTLVHPRSRRARRARLALVACVLWLAGVEVLPALHEAMHDRLPSHRHDGGAIVTVSFGDMTHRHDDGTVHYVAPSARMRSRSARDGQPHAADVGHQADGLAHHAAALAAAPPPVTRPLPVDRRVGFVEIERTLAPIARDPLAATARGPPPAV